MNIDELRKNPPKPEVTVAEIELIALELEINTDSAYIGAAEQMLDLASLRKKMDLVMGLLKTKAIAYQLEAEASPVIDMPVAGQLAPPAKAQGAPKVEGISTARKWKVEVLDNDKFCFWLMENFPNSGYVQPVMKEVEKRAKQVDGQLDCSGARVFQDRNMRVTVKE